MRDGVTDRWTDRRTDRRTPSYRDATSHLKMTWSIFYFKSPLGSFKEEYDSHSCKDFTEETHKFLFVIKLVLMKYMLNPNLFKISLGFKLSMYTQNSPPPPHPKILWRKYFRIVNACSSVSLHQNIQKLTNRKKDIAIQSRSPKLSITTKVLVQEQKIWDTWVGPPWF